jgi:hypothetical protein
MAMTGDKEAAMTAKHFMARRSAILGYDAPLKIDAVQLVEIAAPQETSTERYRRMLDLLDGTPDAGSRLETGTGTEPSKRLQ